jgi:putative toxin-antitoxin system antitoxin component (TIGR02293 family)
MNKALPSKSTIKETAGSTNTAVRNSKEKTTTNSAKNLSYKSADNKNVLELISIIRNGISYKDFNKIVVDTPFSLTEWANFLQISERTIHRNQKEKKNYQPIQSERILELSMLYQYGVEVFGDKDNFDTWLNSISIALGGRIPKDLLDTKFGMSMVKDELGRIEHGILA